MGTINNHRRHVEIVANYSNGNISPRLQQIIKRRAILVSIVQLLFKNNISYFTIEKIALELNKNTDDIHLKVLEVLQDARFPIVNPRATAGL